MTLSIYLCKTDDIFFSIRYVSFHVPSPRRYPLCVCPCLGMFTAEKNRYRNLYFHVQSADHISEIVFRYIFTAKHDLTFPIVLLSTDPSNDTTHVFISRTHEMIEKWFIVVHGWSWCISESRWKNKVNEHMYPRTIGHVTFLRHMNVIHVRLELWYATPINGQCVMTCAVVLNGKEMYHDVVWSFKFDCILYFRMLVTQESISRKEYQE